MTPDAWSGIHSSVPSSIAPTADQRDFMVRVRAVYQGQGSLVTPGGDTDRLYFALH